LQFFHSITFINNKLKVKTNNKYRFEKPTVKNTAEQNTINIKSLGHKTILAAIQTAIIELPIKRKPPSQSKSN